MKIFSNANIYTLDPNQPSASALVIDKGRILAIGDETYCQTIGRDAPIEDLGGQTVTPGFTDAHIHLEEYALSLLKINCEVPNRNHCLNRVSARAIKSSPGNWILGHGWNQNEWQEGFGNASILDAVSPNNPVYLTAKSLHAGWANSQALKIANINKHTPDPPDGQIQRDEQGRPTGILFEGAMRLIADKIPEVSQIEITESILNAQENLWRMGVTGIHDFDRRDCFIALQNLRASEKLKLRVTKSLPIEDMDYAIALGIQSGFGDDWLRIGGLKAFADGALGPQTAAMLAPYETNASESGMLLMDGEEIFELGRKAVKNGLSLAIHAIGDLANHEVLNAFEQLRNFERTLNRSEKLRHRIEHVQLLHPNDLSRLGQLDIIASMQPIHAPSDMKMADKYWGARAAYSYSWNTQLQHGAKLIFGSDAPVESPNPFWGLHAAITRQHPDGSPGPDGWYPNQRISIHDAVQAYTTGPAYAVGMENRLGKLAPGFLADLLVLEENLFTCNPTTLRDIKPKRVMIAGEWVVR